MKSNFLRILPSMLVMFLMLGQFTASAQCTNTASFGTATAPSLSGNTVTITTCNFPNEFATINGMLAGHTYVFTSSVATDFLTLRSGTSSGPSVGFGTTPLSVTTVVAGTHFLHINLNSSCATQASGCRTTTVACTSCPAPPPPPGCDVAVDVACGQTYTGTTVGGGTATNLGTCITALNTAPGRWYRTQGTGGMVTVTTCSAVGFDTKIGVFSGTCGGLVCVTGNDDATCAFSGLRSTASFTSVLGTNYYIYVTGFGTASGAYEVTFTGTCIIPPPPPPVIPATDLCANAIAITCGSSTAGTTVNATTDGVATCGTSNTAPGVWYTMVGDGDVFTLSLCGSSYDTKLSVYTGTCGALVCVDGNDDFCGLQSEVDFISTPGTTYRILVHGFSANTGTFTLNASCAPICPAPIDAPWTVTAIGGAVGTAVENCDGTFSVSTTGVGTSTADKIHFVHQTLTGNGYVVVDVSSFTNFTFGGVQFRDGLAAGARKVALQSQLGARVTRELRTVTNGAHTVTQLAAPKHNYLRIARVGDVFTSSVSANGTTWTQVNTVTVTGLPTTLNVGFYVNSQLASSGSVNFDAAGVFGGAALNSDIASRNGEGTSYTAINAYPNPANNELNIKMAHLIGEKVQITVMNTIGQVALQQNFDSVNEVERLDISKLSSGVYFLQVNTEAVQKIIVNK
ncbi:MAG: T9SS type A sorting domain-containing protein [Saprospiraceae bacterium]|nr:T9SS type A sorting domain-containing protein [Saprospiraceae bacterium]